LEYTTPFLGNIKKGGNMTKAEIVGKIAEGAELTKAQAEKAAAVFLDSIVEALKDGDKVTFVGFGTFSVNDKAARIGRNPQTGAEISISARRVLTFKSSQVLRRALND